MEFLGVGPVELLVIIILGLIVVGPERLPEMARSAGRFFGRLIAWQQQSPEFQTIQQVRQEIQNEITGLRNEISQTQQQVVSNVQALQQSVPSLKEELAEATNEISQAARAGGAAKPAGKPSDRAKPLPATYQRDRPGNGAAEETADQPGNTIAEEGDPRGEQSQDGSASRSPLSSDEFFPAEQAALLVQQIQSLSADMHALQEQLRAKGYLDADWTPPSH
jgi:sec-independent protein translocase protein TatB